MVILRDWTCNSAVFNLLYNDPSRYHHVFLKPQKVMLKKNPFPKKGTFMARLDTSCLEPGVYGPGFVWVDCAAWGILCKS